MTSEQAKAYLEKTMWYEMAELAKIQPMPDHVREKREETLAILKRREENRGKHIQNNRCSGRRVCLLFIWGWSSLLSILLPLDYIRTI